ncbi:sensor histidine kinase [Actinoallomurus rhizosphaericola]|uniref:sensor histidine kinase n=1 Tax=Actinoallomurus rhizosphaericola TaxID=2952536 RepID=UPI0020937F21|nr:histidine kinase [Actinoallomurus rhizosphaericola]MCO5995961.1 histidine kinase [Actinoallomurus rhizosphaericola]
MISQHPHAGPAIGPRPARLIVAVVLAAFAGVYVLAVPFRTGGATRAVGAVTVTVLLFASLLAWVLPRTARFRGVALATAQTLLACVDVLVFGTSVGVLAFAAGPLLLASYALPALAVLAGAVVVAALRFPDAAAATDAAITPVLGALVVYGLVRLADRVTDLAAARPALTMAAVARERLRIATELNTGIGRGLDAITAGSRRALDDPGELDDVLRVARRSLADARAAAAGFRAMSLTPEATAARALLSAAGIEAEVRTGHDEPLGSAGALLATVLREAVTDVVRQGTATRCVIETSEQDGKVRLRVSNDGAPTAARGEEGLTTAAERVEAAGGTLTTGLGADGRFTVEATIAATPRPVTVPDPTAYALSVTLLAVVVAGFCVKALLHVPWGATLPVAVAGMALLAVLQLRWTADAPPRHPYALLAAQTLLSLVPVLWFGTAWLGTEGFLAGTFLVALPIRAGAPLVVAVVAGSGAMAAALSQSPARIVNYTVSALVTGLLVYGLVRLARLIHDLRDAGAELARAATVQERLRAARDLHDLLGHSLAAMLLKCELARRLAQADPERARAELTEVVAMAERARADLRTASGAGEPEMSLEIEAESARSVLTAAGVETRVDLGHGPLPGPSATVLSTVLREAVTNILRHSAARHCAIVTTSEDGFVTLTVDNDGLDPRARRTPPGSGIGNLTTRLAAVGGTLTARADGDGGFRLQARLRPDTPAPEPAGSEPAGAAGPRS